MTRAPSLRMLYPAEAKVYSGMKDRCLNPNSQHYKDYGGRGVKICARWLESFDHFFADMGPRPSADHSLDRIDNDGYYEPGNCRWATRAEQARNKRNTTIALYRGRKMKLQDLCDDYDVPPSTVYSRLSRGVKIEAALRGAVAARIGRRIMDARWADPGMKRDLPPLPGSGMRVVGISYNVAGGYEESTDLNEYVGYVEAP